jgi:hypothetical protein
MLLTVYHLVDERYIGLLIYSAKTCLRRKTPENTVSSSQLILCQLIR